MTQEKELSRPTCRYAHYQFAWSRALGDRAVATATDWEMVDAGFTNTFLASGEFASCDQAQRLADRMRDMMRSHPIPKPATFDPVLTKIKVWSAQASILNDVFSAARPEVVVSHGHKVGATFTAAIAATRVLVDPLGNGPCGLTVFVDDYGRADRFRRWVNVVLSLEGKSQRPAFEMDVRGPLANGMWDMRESRGLHIFLGAGHIDQRVLANVGTAWKLVLGVPSARRDNALDAALDDPRYRKHFVASTTVPNVAGGEEWIDGLATKEWIEKARRENTPEGFDAHVLGRPSPKRGIVMDVSGPERPEHPKSLKAIFTTVQGGFVSASAMPIEATKAPPPKPEPTKAPPMNMRDAANFLVKAGLLFEINRRVLHPLGLSLAVMQHDDGHYELHSLNDVRHDPEGIIFADEDLADGTERLLGYMGKHGGKAHESRRKALGYVVQPLAGQKPGKGHKPSDAAQLQEARAGIREIVGAIATVHRNMDRLAARSLESVTVMPQPPVAADHVETFLADVEEPNLRARRLAELADLAAIHAMMVKTGCGIVGRNECGHGFRQDSFHHHTQVLWVHAGGFVWWETYRWPANTGSSDVEDALRNADAEPGSARALHVIRKHAKLVYRGTSYEAAKNA